jgi:hypothetical protein
VLRGDLKGNRLHLDGALERLHGNPFDLLGSEHLYLFLAMLLRSRVVQSRVVHEHAALGQCSCSEVSHPGVVVQLRLSTM